MTFEEIKNFIKEHFKYINSDDFYAVWYRDEEDIQENQFDDLAYKIHAADCSNGITKVCFFFDELTDWVVKIPFFGKKYVDWNEEMEDYDYDNIDWEDYIKFNEALRGFPRKVAQRYALNDWNYCAVEEAMYIEAQNYNLDHYLAETRFVVEINDVPIYISRKYDIDVYDGNDESNISRDVKDLSGQIYMHSTSAFTSRPAIEAFVNYYGEHSISELEDFFRYYNIGDFHAGNIQYNKDMVPVIIDYSGYHEDSCN